VDVRTVGRLIEVIHAPVYFAPEPQEAYAALGLRGYWRGYFASRAAALGTPGAATVTRLFGGFAPRMVERAIPEVWTLTTPAAVLDARSRGAVAALQRLVGDGPDPRPTAEALARIVDAADYSGRPLAAAHFELPVPADPLGALWHRCTVLRELRGDEHLAALTEADLPWPQPHLLLARAGRLDPKQREYRGFTEAEWQQADAELSARGLTGPAATELVEAVERRTDERVQNVFADTELSELDRLLRPFAIPAVAALPFPNAVGLPNPVTANGA
jgi:hypothetical protein